MHKKDRRRRDFKFYQRRRIMARQGCRCNRRRQEGRGLPRSRKPDGGQSGTHARDSRKPDRQVDRHVHIQSDRHHSRRPGSVHAGISNQCRKTLISRDSGDNALHQQGTAEHQAMHGKRQGSAAEGGFIQEQCFQRAIWSSIWFSRCRRHRRCLRARSPGRSRTHAHTLLHQI